MYIFIVLQLGICYVLFWTWNPSTMEVCTKWVLWQELTIVARDMSTSRINNPYYIPYDNVFKVVSKHQSLPRSTYGRLSHTKYDLFVSQVSFQGLSVIWHEDTLKT